jgi:hypothetical protein
MAKKSGQPNELLASYIGDPATCFAVGELKSKVLRSCESNVRNPNRSFTLGRLVELVAVGRPLVVRQ